MTIDFYYTPESASCRSVLLTAKAIGVDLNLTAVDLGKRRQLHLELTKEHPVPTLVDNEIVLSDIRAILVYLVETYDKSNLLYPKHPTKRALIDNRLNFDLEKLYPCFTDCYYPMIFRGASSPDSNCLAKAQEIFKHFNSVLERRVFAAGDSLTIADLALVATVSTFDIMNFDLTPYENVTRWYDRVKHTAPGYEEANGKNVAAFKRKIEILTKKLQD